MTVGARSRLAHQNVTLLRLEPHAARRLLPADIDFAGHHAGAAGATGAGCAFKGKGEALSQAGIKNRLGLAAVEAEFAVVGWQVIFRGAGGRCYLKISPSPISSPSGRSKAVGVLILGG